MYLLAAPIVSKPIQSGGRRKRYERCAPFNSLSTMGLWGTIGMSQIDALLADERFRGIWRSRELLKDGQTEEGWSVTFALDLEMVEIAYEPTAARAAVTALKWMRLADKA